MNNLRHPENAWLDFQRHTGPAVYLAQSILDGEDIPEQVRALCLAVHLVYEQAGVALEESVWWAGRYSGGLVALAVRLPSANT